MNVCVITAFGFCGLGWAQEDNALKLWYRQAAAQWVQALPIGNGRLAAMVFGDVRKEHSNCGSLQACAFEVCGTGARQFRRRLWTTWWRACASKRATFTR